MNCNEYENLITDYLEGIASPAQRARMESHLADCEKCRAMAEREKSVMEQLNVIPIAPCPDEVIERVMSSISTPRISLSARICEWFQSGQFMRRGAVSLAGSFAIIMLFVFFMVPGQQETMTGSYGYSTEEIQQATVEAKLALNYFAVYSRKAENALDAIHHIDRVVKPTRGKVKKAISKIPYI